jgi:hypothetical protein
MTDKTTTFIATVVVYRAQRLQILRSISLRNAIDSSNHPDIQMAIEDDRLVLIDYLVRPNATAKLKLKTREKKTMMGRETR